MDDNLVRGVEDATAELEHKLKDAELHPTATVFAEIEHLQNQVHELNFKILMGGGKVQPSQQATSPSPKRRKTGRRRSAEMNTASQWSLRSSDVVMGAAEEEHGPLTSLFQSYASQGQGVAAVPRSVSKVSLQPSERGDASGAEVYESPLMELPRDSVLGSLQYRIRSQLRTQESGAGRSEERSSLAIPLSQPMEGTDERDSAVVASPEKAEISAEGPDSEEEGADVSELRRRLAVAESQAAELRQQLESRRTVDAERDAALRTLKHILPASQASQGEPSESPTGWSLSRLITRIAGALQRLRSPAAVKGLVTDADVQTTQTLTGAGPGQNLGVDHSVQTSELNEVGGPMKRRKEEEKGEESKGMEGKRDDQPSTRIDEEQNSGEGRDHETEPNNTPPPVQHAAQVAPSSTAFSLEKVQSLHARIQAIRRSLEDVQSQAVVPETPSQEEDDFTQRESGPAEERDGEMVEEAKQSTLSPPAVVVGFSGFADSEVGVAGPRKDGKDEERPQHGAVSELERMVVILGGSVDQRAQISRKLSHLVVPPNSRTYRSLAATLMGKWLVTPQWVKDSYAGGRWLEEAPYGHRVQKHPLEGLIFAKTPAFQREHAGKPFRLDNLRTLVKLGFGRMVEMEKDCNMLLVGSKECVSSGKPRKTWNQFLLMIPGGGVVSPSAPVPTPVEGQRSGSPAYPPPGFADIPIQSSPVASGGTLLVTTPGARRVTTPGSGRRRGLRRKRSGLSPG